MKWFASAIVLAAFSLILIYVNRSPSSSAWEGSDPSMDGDPARLKSGVLESRDSLPLRRFREALSKTQFKCPDGFANESSGIRTREQHFVSDYLATLPADQRERVDKWLEAEFFPFLAEAEGEIAKSYTDGYQVVVSLPPMSADGISELTDMSSAFAEIMAADYDNIELWKLGKFVRLLAGYVAEQRVIIGHVEELPDGGTRDHVRYHIQMDLEKSVAQENGLISIPRNYMIGGGTNGSIFVRRAEHLFSFEERPNE